MKRILLVFFAIVILSAVSGQTVIKMEKQNGVYMIPCKVNGLSLDFIFDTGAGDVSISVTEALFMLKNGYLKEDDITGTAYYTVANGDIEEGTTINLRMVEIGNLKLHNVEASIVYSLDAPLLLGQSALRKLGKIEFDYANNTLTIKSKSPANPDDSRSSDKQGTTVRSNESSTNHLSGSYKYRTSFQNPVNKVPLLSLPNSQSRVVYKCPKNAIVYVIDNSDDTYFKVSVDGRTGYVSTKSLARKSKE